MEKFYTPEQVSKLLQLKAVTVHRWLRDGRLKGFRLGRLWRISRSQLEEFLDSNSNKGGTSRQ